MNSLIQIIDLIGGDPYQILQCTPNQQLSIIKKQYRKLALKWHPDRNKTDDAKIMFININRAYQFLEIDQNRKLYQQHKNAIDEANKRIQNMSAERKKYAEQIKRREEEYIKSKKEMDQQIKKKRQFYQRKMKQEQQRQQIRNQIKKQMKPQTFYQDISAITVQWQQGLSFNQFLLENAFKVFGQIIKIQLEPKRKKAKVVFSSIQACTNTVKMFNNPLVKIKTFLPPDRRNHLLKALQINKKTEIDFTLNTDTISRLKQIINRNSSLYTNNRNHQF